MLQSGQGGQGMGSNNAQYGERIQQTLSGAGSALQQSAAKISGDNATSGPCLQCACLLETDWSSRSAFACMAHGDSASFCPAGMVTDMDICSHVPA